jgi:hypothetical protein
VPQLEHCIQIATIRPVCQRKQAGSQTALLRNQVIAEYLTALITGHTRDCESTRMEKLCVLVQLDQKIDGASGCLHSCMHCGEAQGDHGSLRAPHAVLLGCTI